MLGDESRSSLASDGADGDNFGRSVAISGNAIVVGAHADDNGTNTDQGSVYIYERDQGGTNAWGEVKKLLASDGNYGDLFGNSVAISGNTVVVGAYYDDEPSTDQGSAYIFERDQGGTNAWGEVKKLLASDANPWFGYFGYSVAISGDRVVVGAPFRGVERGAAYLYRRNVGGLNMWGQTKKMFASDRLRGDNNGYSVAVDSNTIVVGAYGDDIDTNIDQGSAYIFND